MIFSLLGQLKGPECRRVITQAVALRRLLEPFFHAKSNDQVKKVTITLRVGGSLGSFGPEGVENIQLDGKELVCDLVVADMGWDGLNERQIIGILRQRISGAIEKLFKSTFIDLDIIEFYKFVESII